MVSSISSYFTNILEKIRNNKILFYPMDVLFMVHKGAKDYHIMGCYEFTQKL